MAKKKRKKKRSLIQKLPSILCMVEAGKSQVKIGDAREFVKNLSLALAQEPKAMNALLANGFRLMAKKSRLARKVKAALKQA